VSTSIPASTPTDSSYNERMTRGALLAFAVACVSCGSSSGASNGASPDGGDDASVVGDGGSSDASFPDGAGDDGPLPQGDGGSCGYKGEGTALHVAAGVDICLPPVVCTSENCPPPLGQCVGGKCIFDTGYQGVQTLPEAWATHYCALSTGGCHGVTQIEFPEDTAQAIATQMGLQLCDGASSSSGTCVGIAASSAMIVGNSQLAIDPATGTTVTDWGLGLTEASGLCYAISGPGGSAVVALTDRCGGYCKCNGSGYEECGPCVSAPSMAPNCPCVGTDPGLFDACCGNDCPTLVAECDWCAANNHPHFDLDDATFDWVCGAQATRGSCQLSAASYVPCLGAQAWPPSGGSGGCGSDAFDCNATPVAHQDVVPNTSCCCDYDDCPQPDGSCAAPPAECKAGSCACGAGEPDANHPSVPSTGCCCVYGATPQADGTCQ
jgi:hypothetical protein